MNITVTENVSAVTFNNVPLYKTIMEDTLTAVAEAGINIDMISMTAPTSERFGFGFTVNDEDMPKLLGVIKALKESHAITPMINSSVVNSTLGIDDKRNYPLYRTFSVGVSVQF